MRFQKYICSCQTSIDLSKRFAQYCFLVCYIGQEINSFFTICIVCIPLLIRHVEWFSHEYRVLFFSLISGSIISDYCNQLANIMFLELPGTTRPVLLPSGVCGGPGLRET